ncbi:MAG: phosphotransferase [Mycobacterium sp.]|nr:phosphotransferase [Mycobacterium sp.]
MTNLPALFAEMVCRTFGLGQPDDGSRVGSGANVVWRLATSTGDYVVKELPMQRRHALIEAASFEYAAWRADLLPMPEPRPDRDGALVAVLPGSRGIPAAVRVHRHAPGRAIRKDRLFAGKAGYALATIQNFGTGWVHTGPAERLWSTTDRQVLNRFRQRWPDLRLGSADRVLAQAQRLANSAQPHALVFSHADHKPENCLAQHGNLLLTLDWDEAGTCEPRAEAVESALRWSWTAAGGPDPVVFASFVDGYRSADRPFPPIRECDWAG